MNESKDAGAAAPRTEPLSQNEIGINDLIADGGLPERPRDEVPTLSLYRCTICDTRWLLWPVGIGGTLDATWNLLDWQQKPGPCCDNVAMGKQIEHLRDIPLRAAPATGDLVARLREEAIALVIADRPGDRKTAALLHEAVNALEKP